jgi:phosphoglycolate phosphatase
VSLIVFDLDGTLIDSQRDLADAANALILERGGTPLTVEEIAAMVGEGAGVLIRRVIRAAHIGDDVESALRRFLELYDERLLATTRLYDGMPETLEALASEAPLAVLTNKPQQATERILQGLGIATTFRWVIGGDSRFGRKPDPAGLRHLMAEAGAAPARTMMVGDSAIDLATARAAGTRICLARYGFGFRIPGADLHRDELIVDRPSEIVPAVRASIL